MITLLTFDLARIAAVREDPSRVDGLPIVDGSLPPPFVVERAAEALATGAPLPWSAPLLFVHDGPRRVVGSGIFKGVPDDGWVEIGYGIAASVRNRGHATDAVFALVRLAFDAPDVRAVYAETAVVNHASRRVLRKVGFEFAGQRFSDDDGMVDRWFVER